jgi:hypothetical protein
MNSLLVVVGLLAASAVAQDKDLPELPLDFSLAIEANFEDRQRTLHFNQYHMPSLGFDRVEYIVRDTLYVRIVDFNTKSVTNLVYEQPVPNINRKPEDVPQVLNCTVSNFTGAAFDGGDQSDTLTNFTSMFFFGGDFDETYLGEKLVRGIVADHWVHRFIDTAPFQRPGMAVKANYTQDFYFSQSDWSVDGRKRAAVPLMSVVAGTYNDTEFSNTYVFSDFRVGVPPLWQQVTLFGGCDIQQRIVNANQTRYFIVVDNETGIAIGMLILGIIFGVCFTSIACVCIARRRQRRLAAAHPQH